MADASIKSAHRAWVSAQLAAAKKDLKRKNATEKAHASAMARATKYAAALERLRTAEAAGAGGKKKKAKGRKRGRR